MWVYVYILELCNGNHYVGFSADVKKRVQRHMSGQVRTTKAFLPLKLVWCCSFPNKLLAYDFERYLKSGSGRAFARKRLVLAK